MPRSLVYCLLPALAVAPGCNGLLFTGPRVTGSGKAVVETREAKGVNALDASGIGDIEFAVGDAESLTVEGDDNLLPFLHTEVRGGVLKIWYDSGTFVWTKTPRIVVQAKACKAVEFSGATKGTVTGVASDAFTARLSGATRLELKGSGKSAEFSASGASRIDAGAFVAEAVSVHCSGASHAVVSASRSITGSASGASSIKYPKGATASVKTSGASHADEM